MDEKGTLIFAAQFKEDIGVQALDGGHTWPEMNQVILNESPGFGYSCMTMVDDNTVGILYEGVKDLFFQKVPVSEFLK